MVGWEGYSESEVVLAPLLLQLVEDRNRTQAFSLHFTNFRTKYHKLIKLA